MKVRALAILLLLLSNGIALAQVYKWQDASGAIHFGDDPPEGVDAQPLSIPESPTEEDAERTRQHLEKMGAIYDQPASGEAEAEVPAAAQPEEPGIDYGALAYPDCFTQLSSLVSASAAQGPAPITPTELTPQQQKELTKLFAPMTGRWQGIRHEMSCHKGTQDNPARILPFHLRTAITWDPRNSRLTIDSDSVADASRIKETLIQYFEIGDGLFFYDWRAYGRPGNDDRDMRKPGNRVELLGMADGAMSFLLHRRLRNISRTEVRLMEFSRRQLRITEQYFYGRELTGATLWILDRRR